MKPAPQHFSSWKIAAIAVIGFIVVFCLTVPETTADTVVYVGHILAYSQHGSNASPFLLWEFGHLLWRPLGYGLWLAVHPFLSSWSGNNAPLEITASLIGVNFLVGIGLTILLVFLSRRLGLIRRYDPVCDSRVHALQRDTELRAFRYVI